MVKHVGRGRRLQAKSRAGRGNQATLRTLTEDVVKTSKIEGERLDTEQVRSSVARRLGIALERFAPQDRHVDGLIEERVDVALRIGALPDKRLSMKSTHPLHARVSA